MIQLLLILALLTCVILVLIVLIQNPKGGGLSSNFSSSSQLMGVQKTGDFLEKGTWGLAIFLMVLTMAINIAVKGSVSSTGSTAAGRDKDIKAPAAQQSTTPFNTGATPASQTPASQRPAATPKQTK
jgi:preprotein translocase subunit SecG